MRIMMTLTDMTEPADPGTPYTITLGVMSGNDDDLPDVIADQARETAWRIVQRRQASESEREHQLRIERDAIEALVSELEDIE